MIQCHSSYILFHKKLSVEFNDWMQPNCVLSKIKYFVWLDSIALGDGGTFGTEWLGQKGLIFYKNTVIASNLVGRQTRQSHRELEQPRWKWNNFQKWIKYRCAKCETQRRCARERRICRQIAPHHYSHGRKWAMQKDEYYVRVECRRSNRSRLAFETGPMRSAHTVQRPRMSTSQDP